MRICIIIDKARYITLPIVKELMQSLSMSHTVRLLNVEGMTPIQAFLEAESFQANLYILKSHGPESLAFAHFIEQRGAYVINSWSATLACQDRITMTQLMINAGLPWPRTWDFATLSDLLTDEHQLTTLSFPLIVKSRCNSDEELIEFVTTREQLQSLAGQWGREPIIVQEWLVGEGWDTKIWVIGEQVFAAKRRSPLEKRPKDQFQLTSRQIDDRMRQIALEAGRAFNLQVYGVDFLMTADGPIAIDVNSFPGLRNLVGPDKALITLIESYDIKAVDTGPLQPLVEMQPAR